MSATIDAAVAFFRADAQWPSRMVDTCVVKRITSSSFNDSTGVRTPTYTTQYSGACLVKSLAAGSTEFGQELVETRVYIVFVPYTETDPLPDDLVDITSTATYDSFLNGKQFVVRNIGAESNVTVRRLICQEVV